MRVRNLPGATDALVSSAQTASQLRNVANGVAARVNAPARLAVSVRAGLATRGSNRGKAFAQVIMSGPGALAEEFGTRTRAPRAPLRRALRGGR